MAFQLIEPPDVEPLAPNEVRARLPFTANVTDPTLTSLISAARLHLERSYGIACITQTIEYIADRFPGYDGFNQFETGFHSPSYGVNFNSPFSNNFFARNFSDIVIPYSPIQSIVAINYLDPNGVAAVVDPTQYVISKRDLVTSVRPVFNAAWPASQYQTDVLRVPFIAGFGDSPSDVPETIKTAITLHVAHLWSLTATNLFNSLDSVTGVGEKRYVVSPSAGDTIDKAVRSLLRDYDRPFASNLGG